MQNVNKEITIATGNIAGKPIVIKDNIVINIIPNTTKIVMPNFNVFIVF